MTTSRMKIVRAPAELAGSLSAIALAAKRHWRYPERWIEIWTPILTLTPEYVTANPTFAAIEVGEAGKPSTSTWEPAASASAPARSTASPASSP